MDGYLRQSTAGQVATIGPFVDDEEGIPVDDLTIANTDIKLKKAGGASASKNSGGATADGTNGAYHCTFDATDTATVGILYWSVKKDGCLLAWGHFQVLEEAVYDQLIAASAPGAATPTAISNLNNISLSGVKTQVTDALAVDTYAEPTGAPAATTTIRLMLHRLHQVLRNGITVNGSEKNYLNDSGAALWKKSVADDGTTYTEGEGTSA